MRATSKDVAAAAGVSRATVSYVLNQTPGQTIPEATRQRVLEAASRLGYTPHASARALRSGASSLALLITQELPFGVNIATLVDGLTRGTAEMGLSLVTWQRSDAVGLASTLAHLQPRVVVVMMALSPAERALLDRAGIPLVSLAGADERNPHELVTGQLQAQHLAHRGCRRLGVITTTNPLLAMFAEPRVEGVRRACHELGLPEPEVLALDDPDDGTALQIAAAVSGWRDAGERVTGLCAYNDVYAAACLAAAHSLGLDVPRGLAVVGVDDEPLARFTSPPLTTVRLRLDEVARTAVAQVRRVVAGEAPARGSTSMHVELVARESA